MTMESRIRPEWERIYLKPAEVHISNGGPQAVTTVLGSCVSVSFHAPRAGLGGITHGMLPRQAGAKDGDDWGRFVDSSITWMVRAFEKRGLARSQLEVKLFGGAQMHGVAGSRSATSVGRQNVESALKTIKDLGLHLLVSEVGGTWGRKLVFFPHVGEVWIKKISRSSLYHGVANGQETHTRHDR